MMPFSCAASSASAICRAMLMLSSRVSPPAIRSVSLSPSTSSITRKCTGDAAPGGVACSKP